ncbi:MAG: hypothetical protein Kow0077_07770 [Anaerolineae bacterium]
MGDGQNRIYNLISVLFLMLTGICIVLTLVFAAGILPVPFLSPAARAAVPQVAVLPSPTNTFTPLPPTWTYTPTKTATPSSTPTETVTVTPSLTITPTPGPTDTPSITPIPSETPTGTATATFTPSITPTGPTPTFTFTPSPFPFGLRGSVVFTANFANTAGCAWQGIGGQVFGLGGQGLTGYNIRVTGPGLGDGGVIVAVGSNTLYGAPSGWEVFVSGQTNNNTYFVELLTANGTVVSPAVQVTFPNNCAQNLALVNFQQTRPF